MAYVVQAWNDGPTGATPVTAARLTHIESGIKANEDAIAAVSPGGSSGSGTGAVWGVNLSATSLTDGTSMYQFTADPAV